MKLKLFLNKNIWLKMILIFLLPFISLTFFISPLILDSWHKPTNTSAIKYSVVKGKENLIEIFSDGFDYKHAKKVLTNSREKHKFKDFAVIKNFATMGPSTNSTLPTMMGDFNKYNYYTTFKNGKKINSKLNANAFVDHLNDLDDIYQDGFEKTFINLDNVHASQVGDPSAISNLDKSIRIVNYAQSRDQLANDGWGFKKNTISNVAYHWIKTNAQKSDAKPARVLLQDAITHGSNMEDKNYGYKKTDLKTSYESLFIYLNNYFAKLKKIIDPAIGISAYDNSMILIYGDHANHGTKREYGVGKTAPKFNSLLMIKYPHYQNKLKTNNPIYLDDISVYSPMLKHIIFNYFENKNDYSSLDPFVFLRTNKNFALDRKMLIYKGFEVQFQKRGEEIQLYQTKKVIDLENINLEVVNNYGKWKT